VNNTTECSLNATECSLNATECFPNATECSLNPTECSLNAIECSLNVEMLMPVISTNSFTHLRVLRSDTLSAHAAFWAQLASVAVAYCTLYDMKYTLWFILSKLLLCLSYTSLSPSEMGITKPLLIVYAIVN
jgi:hypothetical protein